MGGLTLDTVRLRALCLRHSWGLFRIGVICALSCALSACQEADKPGPAPVASPSVAQPGGWFVVDSFDAQVQEAARFAVQTQAVHQRERILYKDVLQAESQVVAGVNYRLTLQVIREAQARQAQVVVWRKLDGSYQLTSWSWH